VTLGGLIVRKGEIAIKASRYIVQLFFFILFNIYLFTLIPTLGDTLSFLKRIDLRNFPLPISFDSPYANVANAFTVIQVMIATLWFPALTIGLTILISVIFGRAACGWLCPFGFIQDILRALPVRKVKVSHPTNRSLAEVKYYVLLFTISIVSLLALAKIYDVKDLLKALRGFGETPYTTISPSSTLFGLIPAMIVERKFLELGEQVWEIFTLNRLFWLRMGILAFAVIIAIYVPRAWCRWFCPIGALQAIFSKYSFLGIGRNLAKCLGEKCRLCEKTCPMAIKILEEPWQKIRDRECINCLLCKAACPENAIKIVFP
jgi:polyferredoxin